ncbi:hypothetical protein DFH28DRAFT_910592 [Melampsora americana]|nr:hypothetical protein DFH28DRAFT_910592 [Melampsora americana]
MELARLLNGNLAPPTPPSTQPALGGRTPVRARKDVQCQGVNGQVAEGHNGRKNSGCSASACSDCCIKNNTQPCAPHNAIRKRKMKEQAGRQATATANNSTGPQGNIPTLTQADHTFTRRLEASELRKFHGIAVKKQADDRLLRTKLEAAGKIITMVVWSGPKDDWATPRVFRFHAPQWPFLALNEYEGLNQVVEERLGQGFDGMLQVYNEHFKTWVRGDVSMVESYSPNLRTILVVFPGIPPSECTGVEEYLALSRPSTKTAMDIRAFLPPALAQSTSTSRLVSDNPIVDHVSDSEPDDVNNSDEIIFVNSMYKVLNPDPEPEPPSSEEASTPRSNSRTPGPSTPRPSTPLPSTSVSITSTPTAKEAPWPNGVMMNDMIHFFELTSKFSSNKAAFGKIWDVKAFRKSTVSKYHRWMSRIEKVAAGRLKEYIECNPEASVKEGKEHFAAEWSLTTAEPGDQHQEVKQPVKRVKLFISSKSTMPSKSACHKEELSSQSFINDNYVGRTPSSYSTNNATSPPSGLTPSGMVNEKDDQSMTARNVDYLSYDEGFYASLPDLFHKKSISVYHLPPKKFSSNKPAYNPNETVPIFVKALYYQHGPPITLYGTRDQDDWTPTAVVVDFETGPTQLLALEHRRWYESAARARAEAFGRAQSNRYVAMLLELFQEDLFQQWSTKESENIRRMYKHASFLQAISDQDKDKSQWLIAERATDSRNHRYVYEFMFNNKNYKMKADTQLDDVIFSFLHYTYKMSGGLSLIAQLDCDAHGRLSNLLCFTKV